MKSFDECANKEAIVREIAELKTFIENRTVNTKKIKDVVGKAGRQAKKNDVNLKEWDVTGSARLLFGDDEQLLLVDFSSAFKHDCLEEFNLLKPNEINTIFRDVAPLPDFLANELIRMNKTVSLSSLASPSIGKDRTVFAESRTRDWLTFLDKPQQNVSRKLACDITNQPGFDFHLILGGAGTGKTMILRDLAFSLHLKGHQTQLRVPPGVRNFLLSEGDTVAGLPPFNGEYASILLDDPITIDDMVASIDDAKRLRIPLVVAIDPVQWHERRSMEKFEKIIKQENPKEHILTINYRQGKNVGSPAIEAIRDFRERSSEFTDRFRESVNKAKRAKYEDISLRMVKFADNDGTYAYFPPEEYTFLNVLKEFHRVARYKTERKWPKLLVGTDIKGRWPVGIPLLLQEYQDLDPKFSVRLRSFDQYKEVRGTEFESVILFVRESTWNSLVNGVEGAKDNEWERLNAPLTFLTRAENRCAVFVIPDGTPHVDLLEESSITKKEEIDLVVAKWMEQVTT